MDIYKITSLIAKKSAVSERNLQALINVVNGPENLVGIRLVLPRIKRLIPWLKVIGHESFISAELQKIAETVCSLQGEWENELLHEVPRNIRIRNVLAGSLSLNPLYSVFTESISDLKQENLVAPILAVYLVAFQEGKLTGNEKKSAGLFIRKLFNMDSIEGRKLRELFNQEKENIGETLDELTKISNHFGSLQWLEEFRTEHKKRSSRYTKKHIKIHHELNHPHNFRNENKLASISKKVKRKPIWDSKNASLKGLSSDEIGEVEEIVQSPPNANYDVELLQRRLSLYSEMDHQYLLWQWQHLNPNEVFWLKNEITTLLSENELIGFLLGLSISTARSISEILLTQIRFSLPEEDNNKLSSVMWLSPELGFISHPAYQPENAFSSNEQQQEMLQQINNTVVLLLPDVLKSACLRLIPQQHDNQTLGDVFDISPEAAEELAKEWCSNTRKKTGFSRITLSRIKNWGIQQILGVTQDPALTAHLFWFDSGNSSSAYYASYSSEQLQKEYANGLDSILGSTNSLPFSSYNVGSKLTISPNVVSIWVHSWQDKIIAAKKLTGLERLIEEHNCLAAYSVMMLMFSTGHRGVTDPFENLSRFDMETGTFVIADKMDGNRDNGRLVWLPETAKMQIKAYVTHLKGLASRLISFDKTLSKRIGGLANGEKSDLPLFFFIGTDDETKYPHPLQVTPNNLSARLELSLPLNWGRHYLSTQLRRNGVPAEFIHYQLDHLKQGQRFDGQYSVLSISDIGEILQPEIEHLSQQVGWRVISGLKCFSSREGRLKIEQKRWELGSLARATLRAKSKKRFKNKVNKIIESIDINLLDEAKLISITTEVERKFDSEAAQLQAQRMIFDEIKRHSIKTEILLRKYWVLSRRVKKDKSIFTLERGKNLKQGRTVRLTLRGWAEELALNGGEYTEWVSLLLASAVLEGGLLEPSYHKQLIANIDEGCFSFKNIIWFEFENNHYKPAAIKRWLLDPLTATILIGIKNKTFQNKPIKVANVKRTLLKKFSIKSFDLLLSSARANYMYELPSYIYHYSAGRYPSASLPLNAWLRFISGEHFSYDEKNELEIMDAPASKKNKSKSIIKPNIGTVDYMSGLGALGQVRKVLYDAEEQPHAYPRDKVIEELSKITTDNINEISVFLSGLLSWTLLLLNKGRVKSRLTISTVRDYYLDIGRHLYEVTWNYSGFDDIDEEDFIGIYKEVLEYTTIGNRPSNASLLEDLHLFIHRKHGVPLINFNYVEPNRKGRSVRPNLLLENEYKHVYSQMPRAKRSVMTLAYYGRMRGKEIRLLAVKDVSNSVQPVVSIRSVANKKTKTISGVRQIVLNSDGNELIDLNDTTELCRANDIEYLKEVIPEGYSQDIQNKMREVTGDESMVGYDLRHSAVTLSILKTTIPSEFWPKGLERAEQIKAKTIENKRQNYFGSATKTRRIIYQEAMQTGHSSSSTTLASYTHHLDWTLHYELTNKQHLDYRLLSLLTNIPESSFRKIKNRHPVTYPFEVIARALKTAQIKEPEMAGDLIAHQELSNYKPSHIPSSLTIVLEVIRLSDSGASAAVIAQKLELAEGDVNQWIKNRNIIEAQSGYKLSHPDSWLEKVFSSELQPLEQWLCNVVEMEEPLLLLTYFAAYYQGHLEGIYLDDNEKVVAWINELIRFGINSKEMVLIIPSNHPYYSNRKSLNEWMANLGDASYQYLSRGINARSWQSTKRPAIGVSITSKSEVDKRVSNQKELNLLLFSAGCLLHLV